MKIGIIGSGMIGGSMAVLTTGHGFSTVSYVRNAAKIPSYEENYRNYYRQMIEHGILSAEQAQICRKYLEYSDDFAALSDCAVIFECVSEDLALKQELYDRIEKTCPQVRAICSVSSTFIPEALGEKLTKYRGRIVVTHPFNPAHMVPYFEVCGGENTDPEVLTFVVEVLKALDRKPAVLKKQNPGFIGNYLQFALWAAALKLVEEGVCEPRDIDTCLTYSFCPRYTSIGIFEHFDNGGYRLNRATCDGVFPNLPRYDGAPPILLEKAESADAYGAKSPAKKGFYDWNGVDMEAYAERVNAPYWDFCRWDFPEK